MLRIDSSCSVTSNSKHPVCQKTLPIRSRFLQSYARDAPANLTGLINHSSMSTWTQRPREVRRPHCRPTLFAVRLRLNCCTNFQRPPPLCLNHIKCRTDTHRQFSRTSGTILNSYWTNLRLSSVHQHWTMRSEPNQYSHKSIDRQSVYGITSLPTRNWHVTCLVG